MIVGDKSGIQRPVTNNVICGRMIWKLKCSHWLYGISNLWDRKQNIVHAEISPFQLKT